MNALLFLAVRSVVNGVRRALSSPKRLITLVAAVAYYAYLLRPTRGSESFDLPEDFQMQMPPEAVLHSLAFAGFGFLTLMFLMSLLSHRSGFRPADVDMLFPTPIHPRWVMAFRMAREYLVTLLLPFLIMLLGWRSAAGGLAMLEEVVPESGMIQIAGRVGMLSWFLMALFWVAMGQAVSMAASRQDSYGLTARRIALAVIIAVPTLAAALVWWHLRTGPSLEAAQAVLESGAMRTLFFTAAISADTVLAAVSGDMGRVVFLFAGQLALIGGALAFANTQWAYIYDSAASRAVDGVRKSMQAGDQTRMRAELVQQGKLKIRTKRTRFHSIRVSGWPALMWKEWFLQVRGNTGQLVFFLIIVLAMTVPTALIPPSRRTGLDISGYFFMAMQFMSLLMVTWTVAQAGVIDLLRHVDMQKPLPFAAATNVFSEVAAKSLFGVLFLWAGGAFFFCLRPANWEFPVASAILAPTVSVLVSACIYLVWLLFPDVDDPAQRGFRQLMILLGLAVAISPIVGLLVLGRFMKWHMVVAALPGAALAVGFTVVACIAAGRLYQAFNPSE